MRKLLLAGLAVASATAGAALVGLPLPGPDDAAGGAWESPLTVALASGFAPRGNDGFACNTCHYGFTKAFEATALRRDAGSAEPAEAAQDEETTGGGNATYRLDLAPVAAYELAVVWAAPRSADDGLPDPLAVEHALRVPPDGAPLRVPFDLPWPAAAVVAEVRAPREDPPPGADGVADALPLRAPHPRPPLSLALEGPVTAADDLGSPPNRHAVTLAGAGGALAGPWVAVVTAPDPADRGRLLHLTLRAVPLGYDVRLDTGEATGTTGLAHAFRWHLPPPGEPGAPERFHVGVVAFNDHPTELWTLPAMGDRAFYEGNVSASQAASHAELPFDAEAVAAAWRDAPRDSDGEQSLLLHEHTFDGVRGRVRNDRGERLGPSQRLDGQQDVDVPVFPPMPPGTTAVRATLAWEARSPASPPVQWTIGITQRPDPTFRYPAPVDEAPGRIVVEVPVAPGEWEPAGAEGWLQAWPLLVLDPDGRAVFDGRYTFRVEALRGG